MEYPGRMNPMELFVLARRLTRIAVEAMPTEGLAPSSTSHALVMTVAADLQEHAPTTITEIVKRTEFSQSQVSEAVARLRAAGAVEGATDTTDRRRTKLTVPALASPRSQQTANTSISPVLHQHFGADSTRVGELLAALKALVEDAHDGEHHRATGGLG